ncbi:hypothetical protein Ciccas_001476 [Cichlidogyrus casuarinus]|uniref:Uncharacterized protein n=1 Tax=Cichlidogyrus casuarinus TaxID=1844966 RepID=A0ABD2QKF4_9PLAT
MDSTVHRLKLQSTLDHQTGATQSSYYLNPMAGLATLALLTSTAQFLPGTLGALAVTNHAKTRSDASSYEEEREMMLINGEANNQSPSCSSGAAASSQSGLKTRQHMPDDSSDEGNSNKQLLISNRRLSKSFPKTNPNQATINKDAQTIQQLQQYQQTMLHKLLQLQQARPDAGYQQDPMMLQQYMVMQQAQAPWQGVEVPPPPCMPPPPLPHNGAQTNTRAESVQSGGQSVYSVCV